MMASPCGSLAVQLLICCSLMLVFAGPVAPAPTTRRFKWDVEYIMWAPDCQQSVMIGINGEFPGPTIEANAGDLISVEVTNSMHTEGLVIHWHGIRQIGTPWADGTAAISQCPINGGETFTYEFVADKPGTFFYHGHYGMQRAAGLYGSLIVHGTDQQKEPYICRRVRRRAQHAAQRLVPRERVRAGGRARRQGQALGVGRRAPDFADQRYGQFDCSLGVDRDRKSCNRRKTDAFCKEGDKSERCELIRRSECGPFCEGTQCAPVVFDVEPGKTYRLRIASTTSLSALNVQVQGHKLTVVEADGNAVAPFEVDDIDIYSGESYSVLLKTDQRPQAYWISVGVRGRRPKTPNALAILNYTTTAGGGKSGGWPAGAPPATPAWDNVTRSKEFTYKIKAREGSARPPAAVDRRILMLNTQNYVDGHVKWAINHVTLSLPKTPYLGAYVYGIESVAFDNATESPDTFDRGYDIRKPPGAKATAAVSNRVYKVANGTVVDVVLQNANALEAGVSKSHPWHLHGHDFWVLGYGEGLYEHDKDYKNLNTVNPPLRNTVVLFPQGWTALRFVADNPGVWAFHCHIEPHLHLGMGVIIAEGMERRHELNVPKEAVMCGQAPTGGPGHAGRVDVATVPMMCMHGVVGCLDMHHGFPRMPVPVLRE